MRVSEPILPLRIYDDVYDQQRFNAHCHNAEQLRLVYPQNQIPHFQYYKSGPSDPPTSFWLRRVCDEGGKILTDSAANIMEYAFGESVTFEDAGFIYTPPGGLAGGVSKPMFEVSCDVIKQKTFNSDEYVSDDANPGKIVIPVPTPGIEFTTHLKVIIEKFVRSGGSTFAIKVYSGATLIGTITQSGIYNFDFQCDDDISLEFYHWEVDDEFAISYLQAQHNDLDYMQINSPPIGAIELDPSDLKNIHVAADKDIVVFCKNSSNPYDIPPGEYYYMIEDGDKVYISEVFSVISYKEIQEYYKLTWWNECDLSELVLFSEATLSCAFKNFYYLDASLFKPENETSEEGVENGQGDTVPTLKRWKKQLNLEILKCPEFVTDALTAIHLHESILLQPPPNKSQEVNYTELLIKKVAPDVSQVLNDCFQKVNLKLLLYDYFYKTGCCTNIDPYVPPEPPPESD